MRQRRFGHVHQLILQIIYFIVVLNALLEFGNDCSEEHVYHECVNGSLVEYIKYPPEILKTLRSLLVFHCQHKVQEVFVVHLALVGLVFFKYSVDENIRKSWGVSCKFLFFKHTVFVLVQPQVSIIHSKTALN